MTQTNKRSKKSTANGDEASMSWSARRMGVRNDEAK
jgi:hypothetical protein